MDRDVHPMVPVPDAIRMVMRETADILLSDQKSDPTIRISLSSTPWSSILGYVLDEDVIMKEPGYPPYNASIMDGYAINTNNFSSEDAKIAANQPENWTHRVVDRIYAGDSVKRNMSQEEDSLPIASYITTGAVVPDHYNCVVPVEECTVSLPTSKIRVKPTASLQQNKWIRPIGCDISGSTIVLHKGHIIDPIAIGLAKQSGAEYILVKRRIKVGVLSTGNELIVNNANNKTGNQDDLHYEKGKIPDVNRPVLLSMLSSSTFQNTCEPIDLGTVRDDNFEAMLETIEGALDRCDIIITTGGVSMGETDVVERALVDNCGGTLHFGRMHMKPGKPTTFVTVPRKVNGNDCVKLVFAQPGNPCSAVVCTRLLVGPCLGLYFQGIDRKAIEDKCTTKAEQLDEIVNSSFVHPEVKAKLMHDIKLDAKRPEYHRVILTRKIGNFGETYEAVSTGVQRSSRLMSLRDAQGLMLLPHAKGAKAKALKGEIYPVLLLDNAFAKEPVQMQHSIHLMKDNRKDIKVGLIQIAPPDKVSTDDLSSRLAKTCEQIHTAYNAPGCGFRAVIEFKSTFSDSLKQLHSFVIQEAAKGIDLIVVSCVKFSGSFQYHLDVAKILRQQLFKVANALSQKARLGAANQDPATAIFETVVGHVQNDSRAMLVFVHENGVGGALESTRSLIPRALRLARGNKD